MAVCIKEFWYWTFIIPVILFPAFSLEDRNSYWNVVLIPCSVSSDPKVTCLLFLELTRVEF